MDTRQFTVNYIINATETEYTAHFTYKKEAEEFINTMDTVRFTWIECNYARPDNGS